MSLDRLSDDALIHRAQRLARSARVTRGRLEVAALAAELEAVLAALRARHEKVGGELSGLSRAAAAASLYSRMAGLARARH